MDILDLKPMSSERLSPQKFLRLLKRDKRNIKEVMIVPPTLGELEDDDFGSLMVEFRTPTYRVKTR